MSQHHKNEKEYMYLLRPQGHFISQTFNLEILTFADAAITATKGIG